MNFFVRIMRNEVRIMICKVIITRNKSRIMIFKENNEKKYEIEFWDMKSKHNYDRIIVRIMTKIIIIIIKNKLGIVRYKVHFQQELPNFMLVSMKKKSACIPTKWTKLWHQTRLIRSCESTISLCISMSLECHSFFPKNTVSAFSTPSWL